MPYELLGAGIAAGSNLIGAGINAYANYKAQQEERKAREAARRQLEYDKSQTANEYKNIISGIQGYYDTREGLGQEGDVNAYRQALANYNPNDYVDTVSKFNAAEYGVGDKEDYLNPYYSRIIGDTANQIQHTAAGAGLGRGTGAALNIAKGVSETSDNLYRTAISDYRNERDFAYQQYADAIRNNQARLNALREGNQYKLGMMGNLAQDYVNTQDTAYADQMKAKQDAMAANQAYSTAMLGLY